ncbi:hypothetical protein DN101_14720 [Salmonella enterica subsp. enterica]|nr:hypothetical protein [Salmonella enterica subsp. enterica serovar Othmarschen]
MAISKEQWNGIQNTLLSEFCSVRFRTSTGEELHIMKSFIGENKLALIVWIDGVRNEGWGWPNHKLFRPLVQQVWRRKTFRPGASIVRRASKTAAGRKWLKRRENQDLFRVVEFWVCYFNTAASLVRQFKKIEGLELIGPSLTGGEVSE